MLQTLIEGFVLGLSTGIICLATCTPIYLPYLLTEDRKLGKGLLTVMEISVGRFFSYLAFGAAAGYLGANISTVNREVFTSIAYILLSIFLVLSAVRTHRKGKKCHVPKAAMITKSAFILGILTGINFCPSFLIALSKAVDLGGVFSGMLLFMGFFFGTTLFLIPLAFIGQLSRVYNMKLVAQVASVIIAIWFTYSGIQGLIHWQQHKIEESVPIRIVEVFAPEQRLVVLASNDNAAYFSTLRDSINSFHHPQAGYLILAESLPNTINSGDVVFIVDADLENNKIINAQLDNYDRVVVEPDYPVGSILSFLKKFTFKPQGKMRWVFEKEE